ncbi:MiaB/RimO family radical SAM methylthiotransferase [Candidatus Gracilibacteria bacterium]|nr:MiaB/RimO family radical SAM methylthiotransferase [Candidatus Gracilibacteria bacterium]
MNYYIETFGCQMNYADSEKINMILLRSGLKKVNSFEQAQIVILNTCSVRKKGEDKVYSIVNSIKKYNTKKNTNILVGITGCMARKTGINQKFYTQIRKRNASKNIEFLEDKNSLFNSDDKIFGKTDKVDFVFRIEELGYITKILSILLNSDIGNDEKYNDYLKIKQLSENKAFANVVIQTGCDNFCSYCIVPFTRGREKSRDKDEIISEIKEVVKLGACEITLLGQNVNSYGKELKAKLWDEEEMKWALTPALSQRERENVPFRELLEEIDKIEGIDRIRFTSSNPHDMTADILEAHFELDKTCNYLHFALQSGDDGVLKNMNRKHTYTDFKKQVEYLRGKDPYFGISTDIIVGFPGETEAQFQNTVKAMKELEFDFAYIARYSERSGTTASKLLKDNVASSEKARRWHILNNILKETFQKRANLMIGKTEEVIISGISKNSNFYGRTRNFKEITMPIKNGVNIGDIVKVKINKVNGRIIEGEII